MSDLADALDAMQESAPGYNKAQAYAHGPINEVFASRRLKRLLKNHQVTFQTVLGDVVIAARANKLKITSITTDNDDATKLLEDVEKDNKLDMVRPHVMRMACELGDAYLMAWPQLDAEGNETGKFTVSYNDPRTVRILYDPENPMVKRLLIKKWATTDKRVRVDLIFETKIQHWISKTPGGRASSDKDFVHYDADGDWEVDNPYGIPAFHFTTTLPGSYGVPVHKPFYGTQDKLNKLTVSHMGGVDYYSIPQRWATLEPGTSTSEAAAMDEDEFSVDPTGQKTTTADGDGTSTLSSEAGSLWLTKGIKSYGEFSTADPDSFLKPDAYYLNEGATATSTPLYMFNAGKGDFPSGKALETANAPLDAATEALQMSFDSTFDEFHAFLLKLAGFEDVSVAMSWASVKTVDEEERLSNARRKQEIGVPAAQTLKEVGYDGEDVETWMEDGDGMLPQRIAQLGQVAEALNKLAAPVAAGIVDASVVQELISSLLKDVNGDGAE